MRTVWWSAVATIALTTPGVAQVRVDTLTLFPEIRSTAWTDNAPSAISRSFIADMRTVLVREQSAGTTIAVSSADLAASRLTPDRAFAIATRNLRRRLVPYADAMPSPTSELSGMRTTEGASLETSRLLLAADWDEAVRQLGGPVVVIAPLTGTLFFGRDTMTRVSRRKAVPAAHFLELAAGVLIPYGKRDDTLSLTVLRWTSQGWRVVPPMTPAEREAMQRGEDEPATVITPTETAKSPAAILSPPVDRQTKHIPGPGKPRKP